MGFGRGKCSRSIHDYTVVRINIFYVNSLCEEQCWFQKHILFYHTICSSPREILPATWCTSYLQGRNRDRSWRRNIQRPRWTRQCSADSFLKWWWDIQASIIMHSTPYIIKLFTCFSIPSEFDSSLSSASEISDSSSSSSASTIIMDEVPSKRLSMRRIEDTRAVSAQQVVTKLDSQFLNSLTFLSLWVYRKAFYHFLTIFCILLFVFFY